MWYHEIIKATVKLPLFWYQTTHVSDLRHPTDPTRSQVSRYVSICPQVCPAMSTHFICLHTRGPHVNSATCKGTKFHVIPICSQVYLSIRIRCWQTYPAYPACPLHNSVNPPRFTIRKFIYLSVYVAGRLIQPFQSAHYIIQLTRHVSRYARQLRTHRARLTRLYPTSRTYHVQETNRHPTPHQSLFMPPPHLPSTHLTQVSLYTAE